jgi:GT2 family glycosyltransferase
MTAIPERPELIVVDNCSSDGTSVMVRNRFRETKVVSLPVNLGAAARNLAVRLASHPYVAFCDDDTWWATGSLSRAAELLAKHPEVAVLTARIVVEDSGTEDPICQDLRSSPIPSPGAVPGPLLISFLAGASVVRREAFCSAGGFERHLLIGGEEEFLAADLMASGWAIAYSEELEIHHAPSLIRDPDLRRRQGIRNTLWFTWARRPPRSASDRTRQILRRLPRDRVTVQALVDAAKGASWVARVRREIPRHVEEMYALVDGVQFESGARDYASVKPQNS